MMMTMMMMIMMMMMILMMIIDSAYQGKGRKDAPFCSCQLKS